MAPFLPAFLQLRERGGALHEVGGGRDGRAARGRARRSGSWRGRHEGRINAARVGVAAARNNINNGVVIMPDATATGPGR